MERWSPVRGSSSGSRRFDAGLLAAALVAATSLGMACGADAVKPTVGSSGAGAPSAAPSASSAPAGPPPTTAFFLSFDAEPTEATATTSALDELAARLPSAKMARVELTGSAVATGDLTNDRSKALRRGEALRNWFIEHKVSGALVVVKNPGPPCAPKAGEDAIAVCQGVQVDVWLE